LRKNTYMLYEIKGYNVQIKKSHNFLDATYVDFHLCTEADQNINEKRWEN